MLLFSHFRRVRVRLPLILEHSNIIIISPLWIMFRSEFFKIDIRVMYSNKLGFCRKRKLFDVNTFYRENPEKERKMLQALLEQANGTTVVDALAGTVKTASLEELRILKRLLRGAFDSFEPKLHCVRCHKEYLDSESKHGDCEIPHSDLEGSMPDPYDELWQGRGCCGVEFEKEDTICISESHTVHQDDVAFYGDEGLEEDEEFYGMNENVKPCQELGCHKK